MGFSIQGQQQTNLPVEHENEKAKAKPVTHKPVQNVGQDSLEKSSTGHQAYRNLTRDTKTNPILLQSPAITAGAFIETVGTGNDVTNQASARNDVEDSAVLAKLAQHLLSTGASLSAIYTNISTLSGQVSTATTSYNAAVNTLQTATNTYNSYLNSTQSADQNAINTLNTAINNYNNSNITLAQFNTALATYNAYAQSSNSSRQSAQTAYNNAVTAFNTAQATYNTTITNINTTSEQYGIPPIPTEAQIANPDTNTLPTFTFPATPTTIPPPQTYQLGPATNNAATITPPTVANANNAITTYYNPIAALFLNASNTINKNYEILSNSVDYKKYNLRGTKPFGQVSYISKQDKTTTSSGSANGTAIVTGNANNSQAEGNNADAIKSAANNIFQLEFALPVLNRVSQFGGQVSQASGLFSTLPGLRLIGNEGKSVNTSTTAFGVAFALSRTDIVRQLISSGEIKKSISEIITSELADKVPPDKLKSIIDVAAAQVSLRLLNEVTLGTGIALKTPGFAGQVFNTNSSPAKPQKATELPPLTTRQVVSDSSKQIFLKSLLTSNLARSEDLTSSVAQTKVNTAVNTVIQNDKFTTAAEFRADLISALASQGVSQKAADQAGNLAQEAINSESTSKGVLDANLLSFDTVSGDVAQELINKGISAEKARIAADNAVTVAQHDNFVTNNGEFALLLQQQLSLQGINAAAAKSSSNFVVAKVQASAAVPPPLENPLLETPLSSNAIAELFNSKVTKELTPNVGGVRAKEIADEATESYFGKGLRRANSRPSVSELISEQANLLIKHGGTRAQLQVVESFRDFQRPNTDLFSWEKRVMDPAFTLLYFYQNGPMYAGEPTPSNFKKTIDVFV